jgi:hypothetical protein
MAISIIATPGASNANSYCTLAEANTYHDQSRYHSKETWLEYSSNDRSRALIWASRLLDEMIRWDGTIVYTTGALRWPRYNVWHEDGYMITSTGVPQFVKDAASEFAYHLLIEDRTLETNRDTMGYEKIAIGDLKLTVDKWTSKPIMPPSVWSIIRDYGVRAGRSVTLERM